MLNSVKETIMSSIEIRKYLEILQESILTEQQLDEIFNSPLNEDILDNIKNTAAKWLDKADNYKNEYMPALKQRLDTLTAKLADEFGAKTADTFNKVMDKKAGTDWHSNVAKMAAAVAVASALLANPAQAQSLGQRLGGAIVGGIQYGQQHAPEYLPHRDPRVVSGEITPEEGYRLWQQRQMSGQNIPQHVLNGLIGGALTQFSIRKPK
jgi:hypothetical protein